MSNTHLVGNSIRTYRTGGLELFDHFNRKLGLSEIMNAHKSRGVPLGGIVKILVSELSVEPISVLQAVNSAGENMSGAHDGCKETCMLQACYRALGIIGSNADLIYEEVFSAVRIHYDLDMRMLYYDGTSTFLSGEGCALAKHGKSKDHRPDKPQVNIGLAVNGAEPVVPVVSSVTEGNVHDAPHFEKDFEQLKSRAPKGALFVFDKGVDSLKNRKMIHGGGFHFLTACKIHEPMKAEMRKRKSLLKEILRHPSGDKILTAEWEEGGLHYALFLDERRQKSDARKRQEKIAKAEKEWEALDMIRRKKGTRALHRKLAKKIKRSLATQNCIIEQKISMQQRLAPKKDVMEIFRVDEDIDGMFVLVSDKKMSAKRMLKNYRKKAVIEKVFSDIKSVLKLHPLRVWNDDRVRGLVLLKVVCVLLLSLLQMERKELRSVAKSTLALMLKSLTVVVKISKNGTKTVLGYECRHEILARAFRLKS